MSLLQYPHKIPLIFCFPANCIRAARHILLPAAATAAMFLSGCDGSSQQEAAPLRQVKTVQAQAAESDQHVAWVGTIQPHDEVSLSFRLEGRLATRPVEPGTQVKAGEVLATLDAVQSQEQAAAARAEYLEAVAAEHQGQQHLERVKKLYTIGVASRAQMEEATASLASVTARKVRAAAQQTAALNQSTFNQLTAPKSGVITSISAIPGQMVTPGQEVLKLASNNEKDALFTLPGIFSSKLQSGDPATVTLDNGEQIAGKVRYISPVADENAHTNNVRVALVSASRTAFMGATVSGVIGTSQSQTIKIPATALIRSGNQPAVFVVNPQTNTLERRPISLKRYEADTIYISSGIRAGEHIVTAGVTLLYPGMTVAPVSEAAQ